MPDLGAHMSISGGLYKAILRGNEAGCRVVQIFSKNRNQWKSKKLLKTDIDAFHKAREATAVIPVAVHCSYLINLASPRPHVYERSVKALHEEISRADSLGVPNLVMHPGAHLGRGEKLGLESISEALKQVLDKSEKKPVRILLETTAGQGTSLGSRFEHLARILEAVDYGPKLGVCFDTCHVFAAGYEFRGEKAYGQMLQHFDIVIGLSHLRLFHVNDSKMKRGSKVDRHEHPGMGHIGLHAFSLLLNDTRFEDHAFLIETPKGTNEEGADWDKANLKTLKKLIRKISPHDRL